MSCIYYAYPHLSEQDNAGAGWWEDLCERAAELGFQSILTPPLWLIREHVNHSALDDPDHSWVTWFEAATMSQTLAAMAAACKRHRLFFLMDLALNQPANDTEFIHLWGERLSAWSNAGVAGFRCLAPARLSADDWKALISRVHTQQPECCFMAWTPGLNPEQVAQLADSGFEAAFLSLPWWDYRSAWLVEEHERLRIGMSVISPVEDPGSGLDDRQAWLQHDHAQAQRKLWTAAFAGNGILMPMGFEAIAGEDEVVQVNRWIAQRHEASQRLQLLSGPQLEVTALFRGGSAASLFLVNPVASQPALVNSQALLSRLPHSYFVSKAAVPDVLPPAGCSLVPAAPALAVKGAAATSSDQRKSITVALQSARIAIENIAPCVDQGRFPVKRTIGESIRVQADIFMDGHDCLAASLVWRGMDEAAWHETPMEHVGNDRWQAQFLPDRVGSHCYGVKAWLDTWGSYRQQLQKKVDGDLDVRLEMEEGRALIGAALERARDNMPFTANALISALDTVGRPQSTLPKLYSQRAHPAILHADEGNRSSTLPPAEPDQIQAMLSETLVDAMQAADNRAFEASSDVVYPLQVERREARFASWYELFPRSQNAAPGVHGTFLDVIDRLPAIRDMGFDVLYFPPIHPIGLSNRKGKNNAVKAGPDEPGSPYAIGSSAGGHDAVHPQLGSLDDFRELIRAAREHDLEIAMDFAIQCSPDHPWLKARPEWFDWRPDGSLRYAENPPKRYEDIVNPDFYSPIASAAQQAALWLALRDVVLFWVGQGIQTFRVDNPHTKPLPFWQWMIAQVQAQHPHVIFLSEAFTEPKMMYRLAKVGFSQSYTYFTWRNDKQALTDYLTELNAVPVADFFRPNFFVNTPDINPYFLQDSGRPGFLIRAVLAATMSGLWGVYNGFELCEARAIPGKEEYLDSEKYEIRSWDWDRPGNIVAEITRLNQIRRTNPALQSHLGIRFHDVDNDQILFFSKTTPERDNVVLVAISLDPHGSQAGTLELPLWQWGLSDDGDVLLHDLFVDSHFRWNGKYHRIALTQERPFAVWALEGPA